MPGGGGSADNTIDISEYLINFNASDWANQANQYIQSAMNQGLKYSENYNRAAIDTTKAAQQQAQQAQMGGYNMAQAVQAPQRMAAYGALDRYQDLLGLARPQIGGQQVAGLLENQARQQLPGAMPQQSLLGQPRRQQ